MDYIVQLDNAFADLIEGHPQEVRRAIDTAILRTLHSLNDAITDRESIRTSASSFIGTSKT